MSKPLRLVSWNIQQLDEPWRLLAADESLDVALLQEAKPPPTEVLCDVVPGRDSDCRWTMPGYTRCFRTAVARLSDRVTVRGRRTVDLHVADADALHVSRGGTLAVADVECDGETITCISAYAVWENLLHDPPRQKAEIISDASAHRLISDISPLVARRGHKLLIAGDFNILRGYGEYGSAYWAGRYDSIFSRMEALGVRFVGPEAPHGRQADPWPDELPKNSKNVPTYRSRQQTPATAARQLDFVFASESLAERVRVHARNEVADWGPSDHCRVVIDVESAK
jgi:endonuclease/exonuclease/phosphatase family metal-dependent hydrolase